jgi:mono/diheme cytochrome c family protein
MTPSAARAAVLALLLVAGGVSAAAQDVANGAYVARIAGCAACHTATTPGAPAFAGGRELKTPFGSFFGPNITPDPLHGIGRWHETDFRRAMRQGLRPDGQHYFPSFPYVAFARMSDRDMSDLWAYLRRVPASDRPNRPHALSFPFGLRPAVLVWKLANFSVAPMPDGRDAVPAVRGAYIVEALAHCAECHTPRDWMGGRRDGAALSGGQLVSGRVPGITPRDLAKWSQADLIEYLTSGMTPDGDFAGGEMAEVIRHATSALSSDDLLAVAVHLRGQPARRDGAAAR